MAQARFTQVRLRLHGIPWIELALHDGQRKQPNTYLPKLATLLKYDNFQGQVVSPHSFRNL